ncbi:hypothetical protein [Paenibacillus alvei]|uniref:hypothetical protein n=1 Tax=Paenibacillus alvei TaxID=44250 RepID=UPI0013D97C9F|nr:hypothetical protein [Paenibacillus alvei]NEZ41550.1 hypothetical protein [Paenibacillus alvei]
MQPTTRTIISNRARKPVATTQSRSSSSQMRTGNQTGKITGSSSNTNNLINEHHDAVRCEKCGSVQIVGGQRGFSAGLAFLGGVFFTLLGTLLGQAIGGPTITMFFMLFGLMLGFSGNSELINSCMKCGHKWRPRLRKKKK